MASYRNNLPAVSGGGAVIKSVQRGFATIPAGASSITVTINAVDTSKSFVTFNVNVTDGATDIPKNSMCGSELTSTTQITFSRYAAVVSIVSIAWEVVEYLSGVLVQRGTSLITGLGVSVPISSVALSKTHLLVSMISSSADNVPFRFPPLCYLASATSISAVRGADYGSGTLKWQVVSYV